MEMREARRFRREQLEWTLKRNHLGLFDSIRRVLGVSLAVFQSRLELITVELKELKGRPWPSWRGRRLWLFLGS